MEGQAAGEAYLGEAHQVSHASGWVNGSGRRTYKVQRVGRTSEIGFIYLFLNMLSNFLKKFLRRKGHTS